MLVPKIRLRVRLPISVLLALLIASTIATAIELPLRINAGGSTIGKPGDRDHWVSDKGFVKGGQSYRFGPGHDVRNVSSPGPSEIYETVRHQDHDYRIDGLPAGEYQVRFHFTDGVDTDDRAMDYRLNGKLVINDLNIRSVTGGVKRVHIIEADTTVKAGQPLVIECREDSGSDVFEAGIEIFSKNQVMSIPVVGKPTLVAKPIVPGTAATKAPIAGTAAEIRKATGAQTRIVWLQADKAYHYTASGNRLTLMGFDTDDGQGERKILPEEASYSKPVFTPDGKGVVFSDRSRERVFFVKWDGSGHRDLGKGFASDVWQDPGNNQVWVYLRQGKGRKSDPLIRRRLDKPEIEEVVWSRTENGHDGVPWLQLSADGERFSDAFPWSSCGVANVEKGVWKQYTRGCWPGMAPDNSYRAFVFSGSHTEIYLFEDGAKNQRKVNVSGVPGRKGKKVYFPRWSNDVRFLTVSSPESDPKAELFLGKFDKGFESIDNWVQVTNNSRADIFGDAWINPAAGPPKEAIMDRPAEPVKTMPKVSAEELSSEWPGTDEGLVWIWRNANSQNEAPARSGEANPFACLGELHGRARFGRHYEMLLDGGAFTAGNDAGERISGALQSTGAFTVEALVTTFSANQKGPARILSLSKNSSERNLTLGQEGEWLVMRLRSDTKDPNGTRHEVRLCQLIPGETVHVLLTSRDGETVCYRDGEEVFRGTQFGDLKSWTAMPLTFGDEIGGGRNWRGSLDSVAIFDRFLSPKEAAGHHQLAATLLRDRKPVPRVVVEAKLVEATAIPTAEAMGTYRRALVENVYEVTQVVSGTIPEKASRIVVSQWVVMDGKTLPSAAKLKPGHTATLTLESAADHPELEPEFRSSDHAEFSAPVFFDVESHR